MKSFLAEARRKQKQEAANRKKMFVIILLAELEDLPPEEQRVDSQLPAY